MFQVKINNIRIISIYIGMKADIGSVEMKPREIVGEA